MHLSDIKKITGGQAPRLTNNAEVTGIVLHSREVRPGRVFVAIPGAQTDGLIYVEDAMRRGALAVVAESVPSTRLPVPVILVENARLAAAKLAAAFYGWPGEKLRILGVTGTNGKTTVAMMIREVLRHVGWEPGLVGTVAYEVGARVIPASRTTPDSVTLQHLLHQMVEHHCQSAVIEVSSHALVQQRVACIPFAAACFTNLTHDHLDYHGTMDSYFEAKASLFRGLSEKATAVVNHDDPWGRKLLSETIKATFLSYGLSSADVVAQIDEQTLEWSKFQIHSPWGRYDASITLPGRHNISNALACFAACASLGIAPDDIVEALSHVVLVRGRLERVRVKASFRVFVDYAHTDDALRNVLAALRPLTPGRLILVFGCGGNRDRNKRPLMGAVASSMADRVVVTSDNPRNETPLSIIDDILKGVTGHHVEVVLDRREAIGKAVKMAQKGDTVLIAGKGHEAYQEIEGRVTPFDDVVVAQKAFAEL